MLNIPIQKSPTANYEMHMNVKYKRTDALSLWHQQ